jgi:hypothetical protein
VADLVIRFGGRHRITMSDVPPEIHLDEVLHALTEWPEPTDGDMLAYLSQLDDALDVPDEFRDGLWRAQLYQISRLADSIHTQHGARFGIGNTIAVFHGDTEVVMHWLVDFPSADTDAVWASLPNDRYRAAPMSVIA